MTTRKVTDGRGPEWRTIDSDVHATEAEGDGSIGVVEGHGAVFNSRSALLGGVFYEEIAEGAFDGVLEDDVRALVNHESGEIFARRSVEPGTPGSLEIRVDDDGLFYRANLPDGLTAARELKRQLEIGLIRESSFGFEVGPDGDAWEERDGVLHRTIHTFSALHDVSPVAFPAYADTDVAVRRLNYRKQTGAIDVRSQDEQWTQINPMAQIVNDLIDGWDGERDAIVAKMADRSGMHAETLTEFLTGEADFDNLTLRRLKEFAESLGCDVRQFFGIDGGKGEERAWEGEVSDLRSLLEQHTAAWDEVRDALNLRIGAVETAVRGLHRS